LLFDALFDSTDPDRGCGQWSSRRLSGDAFRTHSAKMHRGSRLSDCADRFMKE